MESLTKQLVSEKSMCRSGVVVAKRAWRENMDLKSAWSQWDAKVIFESQKTVFILILHAQDIE